MATVVGMTAEAIQAITNALVQTGEVLPDGTIVLITLDGTQLPIGNISVDPALAEIANLVPVNDDMIQQKAGAWTNRTMDQVLTDLGTDIHTIEGLVPANDDILQRKAGAWANRTIAQLVTDLILDPHITKTALKTTSTNRTTTALADEPTLSIPLDPNSTYDVSFDCSYAGAVAMQFGWTTPASVTGFYSAVYNLAGTGFGNYTYTWAAASSAGIATPGLKLSGYLATGANGGSLTYKWSSATSGQTSTLGTSILRVRKILS